MAVRTNEEASEKSFHYVLDEHDAIKPVSQWKEYRAPLMICTECGMIVNSVCRDFEDYHFCPKCGARKSAW